MTVSAERAAQPATQGLASERLEHRLADAYPAFSSSQAISEANRCIYCHDAPCVTACPTEIDIPEFIRRIGTGNLVASARTILEANPLGLSCARVCPTQVLCVGACVHNHHDQPPIDIGRLQRYATEHVYANDIQVLKAGEPNGRRVACVGAGPASLSAASYLAQLGYQITIFEGQDLPGGLNTTAVAPYKLQTEDSLREVAYLLEIGTIELRTGTWIDAEALKQLAADYDAVFLGLGLGYDRKLGLPGADAEGVVGALWLIERIKNYHPDALAWLTDIEQAVIVGGGNTAIDATRALRQLGVDNVTLVYRRDEASMTGYAHEVAAARRDGAMVRCQLQPLQVVCEGKRATGLQVQRTHLVPAQDGGRPQPHPVEGSAFVLPAQLVVCAIGQAGWHSAFASVDGLSFDGSRLVADPDTGQSGNPKIFTGGDCANGGKEVVNAVAEGKRAAHSIHAWLESK